MAFWAHKRRLVRNIEQGDRVSTNVFAVSTYFRAIGLALIGQSLPIIGLPIVSAQTRDQGSNTRSRVKGHPRAVVQSMGNNPRLLLT